MRVAHFVQRYPPALGGSEAYFSRLSRHLAAAGHHVSVFTTTALDLESFWSRSGRRLSPGITREDGIQVRRYSPAWGFRGRRFVLKALSLLPQRTWQLLTMPCNPIAPAMWRDAGRVDLPFDLVHATAFPYGWVLASALRLARRLRVPFLVTPFLHLGNPDNARDRSRRAYLSPALTTILHAAARIFVQTDVERDALLSHGLPAAKLILQGLGVDAECCTGGDRERARTAWGVASEEIVVGHLANNSVEKGTVDLLLAAEAAWHQGSRFRVVLAGPEMPNFRRFWPGYTAKECVTRLGVLDESGKREFFAGIDAFAMPSRSDSFGLVFLEAWANGLPNLAYRAGGVPGVIRHGQDGLLVRCGDVPGLAGALRQLVQDGALREKLGRAGRARLPSDFCWQEKLELVEAVYRQVVCGAATAHYSPFTTHQDITSPQRRP
jgi:glycosyltransferase involved in cell wall biosynthesis